MWLPEVKAAALGGLGSLPGGWIPGCQALSRALVEVESAVLCSGQPRSMAMPWNLAVLGL